MMFKVMGQHTGNIYHNCCTQQEASQWINSNKLSEPLIILVLPQKKGGRACEV